MRADVHPTHSCPSPYDHKSRWSLHARQPGPSPWSPLAVRALSSDEKFKKLSSRENLRVDLILELPHQSLSIIIDHVVFAGPDIYVAVTKRFEISFLDVKPRTH